MIHRFLVLLIVTTISACQSTKPLIHIDKEKEAIKKVLYKQQAEWNRGDITAFMDGYWRSEELTFIGSRGLTKGWEATLANYKKGYPDKAAMGELSFEILILDVLSTDAARMVGRYTLKREKDTPSGLFTLIWRKINNQWVIVADQTC